MPMTARHFLFLQGPHGPFFAQLGRALRLSGAQVTRVGFNAGDRAFWRHRASYRAFTRPAPDWPDWLRALIAREGVSDLVLYGDTRPLHAQARAIAHALGLRVHVFEEGYLRPYWVTYERDGANGHSRLMTLSVARMQAALAETEAEMPEPPAHWGDMREHIFYGALYHWFVLFRNGVYPHFRPHRPYGVASEALHYSRRLLTLPLRAVQRWWATRRIRQGGFPYHLALLQLDHDANFRTHAPFADTESFLATTIRGFADGAPPHHHLVIKAHPLETGRKPLRRIARNLARENGVGARVHFLPGGKLAPLIDHARSAVTVNSTAAQQALWRGIPLKAFGRAVYSKPEFVSDQPLPAFFADPTPPDPAAYRAYRRFLLDTSQVTGGFYSARGRRQLIRQVVDMMHHHADPYDRRLAMPPPKARHLRSM